MWKDSGIAPNGADAMNRPIAVPARILDWRFIVLILLKIDWVPMNAETADGMIWFRIRFRNDAGMP